MSSQRQRERLQAELGTVRDLLAELRPGRVLERLGLESRARELEEQLEATPVVRSGKVIVAFDGEPVFGQLGIDAKFAGSALVDYQDVVTRVHAHHLFGVLNETRRVREEGRARLQLTSTPLGSFGFALEETQESLIATHVADAIDATLSLLESAAEDDSSFMEAISDMDPRVLAALTKLIRGLRNAKASVKLSTPDRRVALSHRQVDAAFERASRVQIVEDQRWLSGRFLGALGKSGGFEFDVTDGGLIRGRVLPTTELETLESWSSRFYGRECAAHIVSVTTTAAGKTARKHTLLDLRDEAPDGEIRVSSHPERGPKKAGRHR